MESIRFHLYIRTRKRWRVQPFSFFGAKSFIHQSEGKKLGRLISTHRYFIVKFQIECLVSRVVGCINVVSASAKRRPLQYKELRPCYYTVNVITWCIVWGMLFLFDWTIIGLSIISILTRRKITITAAKCYSERTIWLADNCGSVGRAADNNHNYRKVKDMFPNRRSRPHHVIIMWSLNQIRSSIIDDHGSSL